MTKLHVASYPTFHFTNLTEVMSVEGRCCLRAQLEKMKLSSENFLASGHRRQIEPVLHLVTAHCKHIIYHQPSKFTLVIASNASSLTFVKETADSISFQ